MEKIIINSIKINCQEEINRDHLWIICNYRETIEKGIYFNFFHEQIKLLKSHTGQLFEFIRKDYDSLWPQPKSTAFIDNMINYLSKIELNCISRFHN